MSIRAVYKRIPANLVDKLEDDDFDYDELSGLPMLNLDKNWDALHVFLTGQKEEDESPLSRAIHGSEPVGDIENGESVLTAEDVEKIDKAFQKLNPAECAERMRNIDPEELEEMDIYSFDADCVDDSIEEALANFDLLKDFYTQAAKNKQAVLIRLG